MRSCACWKGLKMGFDILLLAASISMFGSAQTVASITAKSAANAEFLSRNYPPESLKRGEQGRVGFQLTFEADGTLTECAVSQSSGFVTLDEGTCEMLTKSAKVAPARDSSGRSVRTVRTGYIDWKLPAGANQLAQADLTQAKATEPLICKRTSMPGSIIKKIKRCMTKSEWAAQDRIVREEVRRAMDGNTCSDHGC